LDFGTIPKVWYFLPFILLLFIMVWFMVFNATFNNISVYRGGFIGGENWSTRWKPPSCRTNFITLSWKI